MITAPAANGRPSVKAQLNNRTSIIAAAAIFLPLRIMFVLLLF
jgi:hypothetical protein